MTTGMRSPDLDSQTQRDRGIACWKRWRPTNNHADGGASAGREGGTLGRRAWGIINIALISLLLSMVYPKLVDRYTKRKKKRETQKVSQIRKIVREYLRELQK